MAEERIIDDDEDKDKNKKYRFRINEDGEEELEIDEPEDDEPEEVAEGEGDDFEIPEFEEDDEDAAAMTPEQLQAELKKQQEEQTARENRARELYNKALALMDEGDRMYALTTLDSATAELADMGEIYPLKLRILTDDYTRLPEQGQLIAPAEGCRDHCTPAQRSEVSQKLTPLLHAELQKQERENVRLKEENEEKKAARRIKFAKKYRVALRNFVLAFVPFIIMLVLGIGFCSVRYADKGGTFLVLTIVFFSLAAVALIASIVMARFLAEAARRVRVNERDTSTAIGREYLQGAAREEELKKLTEIIAYKN